MKKKMLSGLLIFSLATTMIVPGKAFAADGQEPSTPEASSHAATMTGDGTTFNTNADDDDKANDADTNGADVNVWAIVKDNTTPVYKIDIAWGSMKFEFNTNKGTWNTETHTYDTASDAAWTVATYLDGTNNKLDVVNHSDHAVTAQLAFAMTSEHLFNADASTQSAVKGNFFETNDNAKAAALVLDNTANVTNTRVTFDLPTANTYTKEDGETVEPAGARTESTYFAFSGTPDAGTGATLAAFTKVGVITVTVQAKAD